MGSISEGRLENPKSLVSPGGNELPRPAQAKIGSDDYFLSRKVVNAQVAFNESSGSFFFRWSKITSESNFGANNYGGRFFSRLLSVRLTILCRGITTLSNGTFDALARSRKKEENKVLRGEKTN